MIFFFFCEPWNRRVIIYELFMIENVTDIIPSRMCDLTINDVNEWDHRVVYCYDYVITTHMR